MAFDLGKLLEDVPQLGTRREQIEYISLNRIEEDPNNFYQLTGIEDLAANIELCGLQQPIRVRPVPNQADRYRIVSGHRRRAALELLSQEHPEKWFEAPCIVEDDAVSPSLQQLRLIYANANTRTMTPAEVSEQAVQVEELLYQLKEEGYEFPGRMRDHVAQAVGASKSKLARLKVIRGNLVFEWQQPWKDNKIGESVAYALAQLSGYWQHLIFAGCGNLNYLYESTVQEYARRFKEIEATRCGANKDITCGHKTTMMELSCKDRWQDPCKSRCCWECSSLRTCKQSCSAAAGKKKDQQAAYKAENAALAERVEMVARPKREKVDALWQRFGLARELACKEWRDCLKVMDIQWPAYDDQKVMQLECGEAEVSPDTQLPYKLYHCDVARLTALADYLGCSVDYLLCRTDVREAAEGPVSESDTEKQEAEFIHGAWYPVSVEPPVGVPLILIDSEGFVDNGKYIGCGEYTMDYGAPVALWTLEPNEKDAAEKPPTVSSWRSGTPEAYGTYVAYVRVTGAANLMLRELLWDGEEWFLFGGKIGEDVTVQCWAERPEF